MAWGTHGSGPGQFSYPRGVAANESEVIVSDDDNHRVEKFNPEGAFEAQAGTQGDGPSQFAFPYGVALDAAGDVYVADDSNDRIVELTPQLQFAGAWGGFGTKPGQLAFPRAWRATRPATPTSPTPPTTGSRSSTPNGDYLRTIGISAPRPGAADGAARPGDRPHRAAARVRHRRQPHRGVRPRQRCLHGAMDASPAATPPASTTRRASASTRADRCTSPTWATNGWCACGEKAPTSAKSAARPSSAARSSAAPARWRCRSGSDQTYVADTNHNRVLVYGPEGTLQAKWGAGEGDGSAGTARATSTIPTALAIAPGGDVYVATPATTGSSSSPPRAPSSRCGAQKARPTGASTRPSAWRWTGPGNVYVLDSENNRVQEFDASGRFLAKWGVRGDGARRTLPAGGDRRRTAQATSMWPTPTTTASSASTWSRRVAAAASLPGAWPPPLNVAPVLHVSVPRVAGVLASAGSRWR